MVNEHYGGLLVLARAPNSNSGHIRFNCLCMCGNEAIIRKSHLLSGKTKSCGCLNAKHGKSKSPVYGSWRNMIQRCTNRRYHRYPDYGGRGVTVCDSWLKSFTSFYKDMGDPPATFTLDRIDPEGNYEKSNCRWASPKDQHNNQRSHKEADKRMFSDDPDYEDPF